MMPHYPDLGSASDWSCRMGNLFQPIRSTTQIWVETHYQYGISALISQTSFGGENSDSLGDRRAASCESFMRTLRPSNPVFGLAMSGRVTTVHSYLLRSCRNYNNKMCKTKRFSEFVSVKYLDFLS